MTWLEASCSSISLHAQKMHRPFIEDSLALAVIYLCALKKLGGLRPASPLQNLKAWIRSARRRLRSNFSVSLYGTWRRPLTSRSARRWALYSWLISAHCKYRQYFRTCGLKKRCQVEDCNRPNMIGRVTSQHLLIILPAVILTVIP